MSNGTEAVRMVPKLPLMIIEKILEYVSTTKDRKNCRLVCNNWLFVVDVFVGIGLKLTIANKSKLFHSDLLQSCTSLKIHQGTGLTKWDLSYFSPRNLKSVEIKGMILRDNWRFLLEACESMESLTVTINSIPANSSIRRRLGLKKPFKFPAQFVEDKINHFRLRRIVFKNINVIFNTEDCFKGIANMMNSIGLAPRLQQVLLTFAYYVTLEISSDLTVKRALLSLMERNSRLQTIALLFDYSYFEDMSLWDRLLQENLNCLYQDGGFYSNWSQIFDRLQMVDTVYFLIKNITEFETFHNSLLKRTQMLKKLILVMKLNSGPSTLFDCNLHLGGLENVNELSIYFPKKDPPFRYPNILNLNMISERFLNLEYFYISYPVSEIEMTAIFTIHQLKELHIKLQESADEFKRYHFHLALNHPHLKLIFWERAFQEKWKEFSTNEVKGNWNFLQLKRLNPKPYYGSKWQVHLPDEGCILKKTWKNKFADNFVVFNTERLDEHDKTRILKIVKW